MHMMHLLTCKMMCAGVLLQVGFVASFCSKLSDTVSSEVGKVGGAKPAVS